MFGKTESVGVLCLLFTSGHPNDPLHGLYDEWVNEKLNRLLKDKSLSVPWLHIKLGGRCDTHNLGRSQKISKTVIND